MKNKPLSQHTGTTTSVHPYRVGVHPVRAWLFFTFLHAYIRQGRGLAHKIFSGSGLARTGTIPPLVVCFLSFFYWQLNFEHRYTAKEFSAVPELVSVLPSLPGSCLFSFFLKVRQKTSARQSSRAQCRPKENTAPNTTNPALRRKESTRDTQPRARTTDKSDCGRRGAALGDIWETDGDF